MFWLTVTSRNGNSEAYTQAFQGELIQKIRPTTVNNTATAARFEYLENGELVTYAVSESAATVATNATSDMAEAGAELLANKVTSISGASTDAQYGSAKLLYDQLALKAPLASPTLTGIPAAPTAAAGISTTQLATTAMVQARTKITPNGTAAGIDTYTAAIEIAGTPPLAITAAAGLLIVVKFTNANTGAATLNINSTADVAITKKDGTTALAAADITAGSYQSLFHDGTSWVALGIA